MTEVAKANELSKDPILLEKDNRQPKDKWDILRTTIATHNPQVTKNILEQILDIDPELTEARQEAFAPLISHPTLLNVDRENGGFSLWAYKNDEMAPSDMVATCNHTAVSIDRASPPLDLSEIIATQASIGIKSKNIKIETFRGFEKQGLAISLWKLALLITANTSENDLPVIELVTDDSLDVDGKTDWTTRHLTQVKEYMKTMGFESEEIWAGEIDDRRAWAIKYSKRVGSELN